MKEIVSSVLYGTRRQDSFVIRQLSSPKEVTARDAALALDVLESAYRRQFEKPTGKLPVGIFFKHFYLLADRTQVVANYQNHMRNALAKGSRYWLAASEIGVGLAMVSPSRSTLRQRAHFQSPNCYVNDVAVDPDTQHTGIGSALLNAALEYSGFDQQRDVALDIFDDNPRLRHVVQRLGMRAVDVELPPFEVAGGPDALTLTRYSSENLPTSNIGTVAVAVLNAAHLTTIDVARRVVA